MEHSSVSVVVPVYDSEAVLGELIVRLEPVLRECTSVFEVVLVNDGSHDKSWQVICDLAEKYPFVRGLDLMRNYGQHNALLAGVRAAQYEIIITMDDDLQHPPEEIPRLLDKLAEGYDVVYGTPEKKRHEVWRNMASEMIRLVLRGAMGAETARKAGPFRTFRARVCDAFADYQSTFVAIDVLLTWGTTRFASIPVRHDYRHNRASRYNFFKLIAYALDMMTGFSTLPLQLASLMGFAFTFFGLAVLVYVVGSYLIRGGIMPGFAFLASVIAIFSGAQLFALGIIGEYLARVHFRMMARPPYVIWRTTASDKGMGEQHELRGR